MTTYGSITVTYGGDVLATDPTPSAPPVPPGPFGQSAWDLLPEFMRQADERGGYPLLAYLSSVADLVQPTVDLLAMVDPADPAYTPPGMLAFFSALAGIDIEGIPGADLRTFIAAEPGRARGSVAAIQSRVGLTLTGSKWVQVECPYLGDPWAVRVTTRTAQTPDPSATAAAAALEVPAWLVLSTAQVDGMTYDELDAAYGTYDDMKASGLTYDELSTLLP